jgi:hypothetical protein
MDHLHNPWIQKSKGTERIHTGAAAPRFLLRATVGRHVTIKSYPCDVKLLPGKKEKNISIIFW